MEQRAQQQRHPSIAFVVDDEASVRDGLSSLLRSVDIPVETFATPKDFLKSDRPDIPSCLILDVRLREMSGLEFQEQLNKLDVHLPIIFITAHADVPMSVQAMKAGAVEFLCKPFREEDLLRAVRSAIQQDAAQRARRLALTALQKKFASLTPREKQVMAFVVSGRMNKQIAGDLGLSEITVKVHRASIVSKMNARSFAELVRQYDAISARS